jgi:hypothetical protein
VIGMAGASSFFNGRPLPPIGKRRRTRAKDHGIDGDPYKDVDEGIAEEVRIFNDVLGLKTFSSCEGHLVNDTCAAFIVSYIDNRGQLEKIKEAIERGYVKPEKVSYRREYPDSRLFLRALVRKIARARRYIGSLTVKVIPNDTTIEQTEWDKIRRRRFIDVINMLRKVDLRNKDLSCGYPQPRVAGTRSEM